MDIIVPRLPSQKIVVCAALKEEMDVIRVEFKDWILRKDGWRVHKDFPTIELNLQCFNEMGPQGAASRTAMIIERFQPSFLFLCGIMGGFPDKVDLGDLVIASRVIGFEGKWVDLVCSGEDANPSSRKEYRWLVHPLTKFSWDIAEFHSQRRDGQSYNVVVGDIISGNDVWASEAASEICTVRKTWSKAIGVEMEAIGMCNAIGDSKCLKSPSLLVIKGVSDGANPPKEDDDWRSTAAQRSALAVKDAIAFVFGLVREENNLLCVNQVIKNQHHRISRCYNRSSFFFEGHFDLKLRRQRWTISDAATAYFSSAVEIEEKIESLRLAEYLYSSEAGGDCFCLEQVTTYPSTVVASSIGLALHTIASRCKVTEDRGRILESYKEVISALESFELKDSDGFGTGSWPFCELNDPSEEDARVWDTVHVAICFLAALSNEYADAECRNTASEGANRALSWLFRVKKERGWSNQVSRTQSRVSIPLSILVAAVVEVGSIFLDEERYSLGDEFMGDLLNGLSDCSQLPVSESLHATDVKLMKQFRHPDYGRLGERSTILLPFSLQILARALQKKQSDLGEVSRFLADLSVIQIAGSLEEMSLFASAQVVQGRFLWKESLGLEDLANV